MSTAIDRNWDHLYPIFRSRLASVLKETGAKTGRTWTMAEGFRSQERQTWLYSQGRTRPGSIVTWMKHPTNHGSGLAADCYPNSDINNPELYKVYRAVYQSYGLDNPAWAKGDFGHVQLSDEKTRLKAIAWVAAGFPGGEVPDGGVPASAAVVEVNGIQYPHLPVELIAGHAWVALRPLLPLLHLVIERLDGQSVVLDSAVPQDEPVKLPLRIIGGTGYVQATELRPFAAISWDVDRSVLGLRTP